MLSESMRQFDQSIARVVFYIVGLAMLAVIFQVFCGKWGAYLMLVGGMWSLLYVAWRETSFKKRQI